MVVVSLLPQFQETCRSKSETAETNDALPPPSHGAGWLSLEGARLLQHERVQGERVQHERVQGKATCSSLTP